VVCIIVFFFFFGSVSPVSLMDVFLPVFFFNRSVGQDLSCSRFCHSLLLQQRFKRASDAAPDPALFMSSLRVEGLTAASR